MRISPARRIPALPLLTSVLLVQVLTLTCPAAEPAAPPVSSIRELRDLTPEQARAGRPIRIQGYVTFSKPSIANLFIHDGTGGVFVDQSPGPDSNGPSAGDLVEVTGVSGEGMFAPVIKGPGSQSADIKLLRHGTPPEPRLITGDELSRPDADSEWIAIEAWVAEILTRDGDMIVVCRAGTCEFHLLLEGPLPPESVPWDLAESRIVLRVEDKLMILAGSAGDVELLARPPFWTARSVSILAAAVIAGLFAVIAIARSRRHREQETQRREFEAVLTERGRFAREIHDSLAQGLTSISLQLECVRDQLPNNPAAAADHLQKARGFVRDSLREARRTVWNLRPLALGEADLASTLQIHASHLSDSGKITCSQQIEGIPRPLPPDHEAALLRIGQEALTNAARHSAATEIRHRLRYGNGWVTLSVMDNGRGFDVSSMVGKGFGLISMHERVAALGGSLSIDSRNGHGSEVSATLPA